MSIIEKLFDALIEKNHIILLLSMFISFIIFTQLDNTLYDTFPFQEKSYNVISIYIIIVIAIYITLYFLSWLISKFSNSIDNKKSEKEYNKIIKKENDQTIEIIMDYNDSLSEREYSILMYLINNNNQKPFIEYRTHMSISEVYHNFLNDTNKFSKTEYHGTGKEEWFDTPNGKERYFTHTTGTQYLLKDNYYNALKYILKEKGRLCHFERNLVDLNQD